VTPSDTAALRVLDARWPALAARLRATPVPPHEPVRGEVASVRVGGLLLASAHDRVAEAGLRAERIPEGAARAACYGIGLGDLPRALLARPALTELRVAPLSLAALRLALELEPQGWLEDSRVELVEPALPVLTPFAVVPPELQLADDDALPLVDALVRELDRPHVEARWAEREVELRRQIADNRGRVAASGDVAGLFGAHPGGTVLVAAPGPTLVEGLTELRARREAGAPLLAVSSALQPLLEAGIVPDAVVMIDGLSIDPLRPEQRPAFREVPLVYAPEVPGTTVDAWPGPRLAAYLERPRYDELAAELPRGCLWTEGTVTHSAVDLAVRMGAAEVLLFGVDFGYPGGESHARSAPDWRGGAGVAAGRTVLDGEGRRLASDTNLIGYLRDLEGFVRRHPAVRFRKAGRRGAAMEGVEWL
jgi:hypothetical protein